MTNRDSHSLSTPQTAHLVGIAGAGMKSLADILCACDWRISGSDESLSERASESFRVRGMRVHRGHNAANLAKPCDLLIYSPAVPEQNVERRMAHDLGIAQVSLHEFLGQVMAEYEGICVIGTHGKSTTTALTGHLLECAGLEPLVFCGAELTSAPRVLTGHPSSPPEMTGPRPFVMESCEYRRHFLHLRPRHAVLLNIEPDHFDCFPTFEESLKCYREFVAQVPEDGLLIVNADCPAAVEVAKSSRARVVPCGMSTDTGWRLRETEGAADSSAWLRQKPRGDERHWVVVPRRGFVERIGHPVAWPPSLTGRHNRLNALAALALGSELGLPLESLVEGLASFGGIRRRFEVIGEWQGRIVIDDYAHHPTAVAVTLQAARERFPARRIGVVFQPHQISRTRALSGNFAASLAKSDDVLLAPIFAAREAATGQNSQARHLLHDLAAEVERRGTRCRCCENLDQIIPTLETDTPPTDVVVIMGAGDIERVVHEISGRLQRDRQV